MLSPWLPNIAGHGRLLLSKLDPRDHSARLKPAETCPPLLGVETTNICNANCVFCAYQFLQRPKVVMDMGLYQKVVTDFEECGGCNVGLATTVGDPLVDPHLLERIEFARSRGMKGFGFFTNGILFDTVDVEALLLSGLGEIHVSIAGFDRDTYRQTFRVDAYNRVIENICRVADLNNDLGKPVAITVSVRSPRPVRELIKSADFRRLRSRGIPVEFARRYDSWSGKITPASLSGVMRLRPVPRKKRPCIMLWFGATVQADGALTLCGCRDLDGSSQLAVGNLKSNSLRDLWTSARVRVIRECFVNSPPDICVDCEQYSPAVLTGWHRSLMHP